MIHLAAANASLVVVSRLYNQGGDDAEKSGAGGGTDSDSLNRTGPRAMPTRMQVGNRERRKGHEKLLRLEC